MKKYTTQLFLVLLLFSCASLVVRDFLGIDALSGASKTKKKKMKEDLTPHGVYVAEGRFKVVNILKDQKAATLYLTLESDDRLLPPYPLRPLQSVTLEWPDYGLMRLSPHSFALSHIEEEGRRFQVAIRSHPHISPWSSTTQFIYQNVALSDSLWVSFSSPSSFPIPVEELKEKEDDLILMACGMGVAPFVGLLEYLIENHYKGTLSLVAFDHDRLTLPYQQKLEEWERMGKIRYLFLSTTEHGHLSQAKVQEMVTSFLELIKGSKKEVRRFFYSGTKAFQQEASTLSKELFKEGLEYFLEG